MAKRADNLFPVLSGDDVALRETVREFSAAKIEPYLASLPRKAVDRGAALQLLQMVKPFGMLGARVPESAGGDGLTFTQMGVLYEMLPAEASMVVSTADVNAFRIHDGASDEIKQKYLPGILDGTIIVASAISEPNAGSDVSGIRTRAILVGDEYVVNGQKVWSSGGDIADILVVAVNCGQDERGRSVVGRLLVDKSESPVTTRLLDMFGLERHGMSEIFFEDCHVPAAHMIGTPGDGEKSLALSWLSQRVFLGLIAVHIAQEALDLSIQYAKDRVQFGRPIGATQLIQSKLVDMSIAVETSRFLCYRALHLLDQGEMSRYASSVAKLSATEAASRVTAEAMQIFGASGLSSETGLEKLHRDARMLQIPDGTTEIQRLIAGRELVGISAIRG